MRRGMINPIPALRIRNCAVQGLTHALESALRQFHIATDDTITAAKGRCIQTIEYDLPRAVLDLGACEKLLQWHADPARIAHRAVRQLPARYARTEMATAIARTLIDRDDLGRPEKLPQISHRNGEGSK